MHQHHTCFGCELNVSVSRQQNPSSSTQFFWSTEELSLMSYRIIRSMLPSQRVCVLSASKTTATVISSLETFRRLSLLLATCHSELISLTMMHEQTPVTPVPPWAWHPLLTSYL